MPIHRRTRRLHSRLRVDEPRHFGLCAILRLAPSLARRRSRKPCVQAAETQRRRGRSRSLHPKSRRSTAVWRESGAVALINPRKQLLARTLPHCVRRSRLTSDLPILDQVSASSSWLFVSDFSFSLRPLLGDIAIFFRVCIRVLSGLTMIGRSLIRTVLVGTHPISSCKTLNQRRLELGGFEVCRVRLALKVRPRN